MTTSANAGRSSPSRVWEDCDSNRVPDACETDANGGGGPCPDDNGDGVCKEADNCPDTPNPEQRDFDVYTVGDACGSSPTFPDIGMPIPPPIGPPPLATPPPSPSQGCVGGFCCLSTVTILSVTLLGIALMRSGLLRRQRRLSEDRRSGTSRDAPRIDADTPLHPLQPPNTRRAGRPGALLTTPV